MSSKPSYEMYQIEVKHTFTYTESIWIWTVSLYDIDFPSTGYQVVRVGSAWTRWGAKRQAKRAARKHSKGLPDFKDPSQTFFYRVDKK